MKDKTLEDVPKCASMDYEAEYERATEEIKKLKTENNNLYCELRSMEKDRMWAQGFRDAMELIFRK